jgi:hypothetical protein
MPGGKTKDQTVAEAEQLIRVWQANPDFSLGATTLKMLQEEVDALRQAGTRVDDARTALTALINEANAKRAGVAKLVTRGRSAIRGAYGPDSSQYEQVGGTRESDRKPAKRKAKKTP